MQMTNKMDTSNTLPLFVISVSSRAKDHDLLLPVFCWFFFFSLLCGDGGLRVSVHLCQSENWQESFPSILHVSLKHQTQIARLCGE